MPDQPQAARRRLSAILHADIVGYSALMGRDEAGTHAAVRSRMARAAELAAAHGGRVVKTAGDAFLAEFPSVVEAVTAAVEFQRGNAAANVEAESLGMVAPVFRIGVNLGDVIADGDDIFGDGVNVAARVEALAPPGGVALTGAAREQVGDRLDLGYDDRGAHRLKNIAAPVRVHIVRGLGAAPVARAARPAGRLILAALILTIVGTLTLWSDALVSALGGRSAPPDVAGGKPTIAVLPFSDPSAGPEFAYFSAGVTEDVISQLGRFSGLLVLSWSAVAPYRDTPASPEDLSRRLGVRYLVSGTIQRSAGELRVAVQLTDAARGVLLWSDRYEQPMGDLFIVQDRISRAIVSALAVKVTKLEQDRALDKPTDDLGAYDHVLRGRSQLRAADRDANMQARAEFTAAIAADGSYADAYVGLGFTHLADALWGWTEWPDRAIEEALVNAGKAIELNPDNALAHALMANALRVQGEFTRAEAAIERALELNPNDALSHAVHGAVLLYSGHSEPAAAELELAARLDPSSPTWVLVTLALAYYFEGRFEEAATLLDHSGRDLAEDVSGYAVRAAALAELGRIDDAKAAARRVRLLYPFFDAASFARNVATAEDAPRLVESLAKAGLN